MTDPQRDKGQTIVRRECARCGAEVRPDKRRHFCGDPYPMRACDDMRDRTYVAVDALLSDEACSAAYLAAVAKLQADNWHNGRESAREWMHAALAVALRTKHQSRTE